MAVEGVIEKSDMHLRMLGGLQLLDGGQVHKIAAPLKATSLLAYLIIHRAQPTSRDTIAFTFWPDDEETRARANLRRHIALIVHALPHRVELPILGDNRAIRWNPLYPCAIDVADFERLSARSEDVADAAALYGGDLLPSIDDEWVLPERERLRSLQSTNLECLTERYASAGDYTRAIATIRGLLLHDPWREDALRTLLSLRHASGDRAGALQEYESFTARLRRDLDVDPMPETVSRYESILHSLHTVTTPQSNSALERATVSATLPFVGRGDELLRLRQTWDRAMHGFGGVAVVSGEAGIGKTRFVGELSANVLSQGGMIAAGAVTFPERVPYQAVIEALRSVLPSIMHSSLDPTWRAAAADVLPELHDDATLARLSVLEPDRQRDRLFEALWRCFETLTTIRPLLIVLEDVHWAGPATIDLLAYLARRTRQHSILVLITCRDDEKEASHTLRALRQALRRSGAFATIPLGGITADEVKLVIDSVLSEDRTTPGFAKRAHEVSCGNPFYLSEIVLDSLAAPNVLSEPALPRSLARTIETRVAALSADARSLTKLAAVVGSGFTLELVAAAAGTSEGITTRCIDELLDMRLIHQGNGETGRGGDAFAFSHDLIRSQIYAGIPDNLRRRLHRRVGFVLATLAGDESDALATELARHFHEGSEFEKAATAYLTAARQALRLYADVEALRALSHVVELTRDAEVLIEARSLRESIYGRAGRRIEQLEELEALEALADAGLHEKRRFECLRRRINYARALDNVEAQQRGIEALRACTATSDDRYWQAFCSESWAGLMMTLGRYDEALTNARDAIVAYKHVSDQNGLVRSLCLIADISTWRVDPAASQVALDDATAIALASSNEASIVRALAASALAAFMLVDYERARTLAAQGLELCRTIGDREGEADFLFRLGNVAGRRFAVAEAVELYASATTIYEALNKPLGQAIVLLNTALLSLKIGDHAEALRTLKCARSLFLEVHDLRGLTICALDLGMAAYLRGRFAAALRLSQRAVLLAQRLHNPQLECSALGNVGAAERELGERDASLAHSEMALEQRRNMAPMDIGSDLADMGLTYLRAGKLQRACAIAEEIEQLTSSALESLMFPQNVLWTAAQIYAAAHQQNAYHRTLRRAAKIYHERSAKIPNATGRQMYSRLFFNRAICAAAAAGDSHIGRISDTPLLA